MVSRYFQRRLLSSCSKNEPFKILFTTGQSFLGASMKTREAVNESADLNNVVVEVCEVANAKHCIHEANLVVPFMCKIDEDLLRYSSKKLKLVLQYGVGLEGVDIPAASARDIWVGKIESSNTGNAQSCAELAIYLAIAVLRNQSSMNLSLRTARIGWPLGKTLFASTIAVLGYGGIGKSLVERLQGFGAKQIVVLQKPGKPAEVSANEIIKFSSVNEIDTFGNSIDVLFICCNQNKDNVGIIDRNLISKLKRGVVLVNVARGGLLHYPDVLEALQSGQVGGVGTDVYQFEPFPPAQDDPFLSHPMVVTTPHVAGVTEVSYRNMAQVVVENVRRLRRGLIPLGVVNAAAVAANSNLKGV